MDLLKHQMNNNNKVNSQALCKNTINSIHFPWMCGHIKNTFNLPNCIATGFAMYCIQMNTKIRMGNSFRIKWIAFSIHLMQFRGKWKCIASGKPRAYRKNVVQRNRKIIFIEMTSLGHSSHFAKQTNEWRTNAAIIYIIIPNDSFYEWAVDLVTDYELKSNAMGIERQIGRMENGWALVCTLQRNSNENTSIQTYNVCTNVGM